MSIHATDGLGSIAAIGWPSPVDLAVKGAAILAVAWLAVLFMRRASAAARHLVWTLAACATLALPILSGLLPQWRILPGWLDLHVAPRSLATSSNASIAAAPSPEVARPDTGSSHPEIGSPVIYPPPGSATSHPGSTVQRTPLAQANASTVAAVTAPPRRPTGFRWRMWLVVAWAGGSAVFLLRILVSIIGLWRMGRNLPRIEDGAWTRLCHNLAGGLGLRRPVALLRGRPNAMPMTWGFLRPKLLLPAEADDWSPQRRRIVVTHELAHIKRGDFLVQLIVQFALAIHWFNPLMWVASRRIALESEGACDDLVLAGRTRASDYAEHLLAIAAGLKEGFLVSSAAVAMARSSRLEARLVDILDDRRNRRTLTPARAAALGLLLAGVILPVAALRAGEKPAAGAGPAPKAVVEAQPANPAMNQMTRDARAKLMEVERFARLPADQQALGFAGFYRDVAPGSVSPMVVMVLSSYPENIFQEGKYSPPGGDYETRWAKQLADAASTLTPEQVADKLPFVMVRAGAHVRTLDVLRKHPEVLAKLVNEDLDSKELPRVSRACAVIGALPLDGFGDKLLALFLADTPLSKPAESALVWQKDPALVASLLAHVEKDPRNLIRCAGLFQGPLAGRPAEPALMKLLESPDPDVRNAAAYALYECVDPKLAGPIAKLAKDADPRLNDAALNLAMRLPEEAFKTVRDDLVPLLASNVSAVERSAITCFAKRKDLLAGPPILAKLKIEKKAGEDGYDVLVMQALAALADSSFGYDPHNWGAAHNQQAIARFEKWLRDRGALIPRAAAGDAAVVNANLAQVATFRAIVVDCETGLPVPNARLGQRQGVEGVTDKEGKLAIGGMAPGKFTFNVQAEGYARWWSPQAVHPQQRKELRDSLQGNFDHLEFEVADGMAPVRIELERDVRIAGVVHDPDGNPVAGATVAPADGTGNSLTGDTRYSVLTAKDGSFLITLPASGHVKYNLAAHDGHHGQWRKWANGIVDPIQTKPGEELKDVVIKLTRPATVRGHVKDESDKPLAGRQVRASAADKRENRYYDPTTTTDKNGDFELRFIRPGEQFIQAAPFFWTNVPEGGMTLEFKAGETNSRPVTLKAGEVKPGVELTAPASMEFPSHEEQLRRILERMERSKAGAAGPGGPGAANAAAKAVADAGPPAGVGAPEQAAPDLSDVARLKGEWKIQSVAGDETFLWQKRAAGDSLQIDRVSLERPRSLSNVHSYYVVSPLKATKEFDVTFWVENLFLSQQGIYRLEGDALTLCVAPYEKPRPTKFAGEADKSMLIVLKRVGDAMKTRPIPLAGHVVDDATGKPIARFSIQGGRVDDKDPTKITWGDSLEMPFNADGAFSISVDWFADRRARIVAGGYLSEPLLAEAPGDDAAEITDIVVRLKRGR